MDTNPGRRLLHYELIARLGEGGMGEVWRARDDKLDREVAIKILAPGTDTEALQQARFVNEARSASALSHPNIITIHEINSAEGLDFIVMEYVRGEALSKILARGRLSFARSVEYGIQIADALHAAHDAGIVHRDLKPANIIITPTGLVKVLDFGIAKRLPAGSGYSERTTLTALTVLGTAPGTPAYMSPEQTLGDPVDARSDLFSLGIVLYEMLAGMRPFNGPTQLTLIRQIVHESPQALDSSVPGKLTDIVNRCLAKQPDDRYPDASALADDLRRVAATLTREPAADVNVPAAPTATTVPRRRAGMPAAFAVGALLLAVLAWLGAPTLTQWARQITTSPSGQPDENASPQELYRRSTELLHFYYREGNVDRAIRQLELALQKKSPFPQADARLSLAYWRRNALNPDGEWQKRARAHADRAVSGDPQLAVAHIAQGAAFSIAGDSDRAVAAYERAATLDPGNYEIMWRMADLSLSRGDSGGAEEWYKRSTSTAPGEWEPLGRYGSFLYRQGRYLEAVQAWQRTGQLAPDHARVYANLGAAYHQLNRVDDAAAAFQRALEIAPNSGTYTNLGTLLYFQGKYPESVTAFEQAVKLGANTYLYWGNLADAVRMTAPGSEKMHESYRRAIQLARERQSTSPDDAEVRASLALYLARDGQLREATQELERALALKGVAPGALFKGALVAELSSQRTRALGYLERALAAGYGLREVRQEPDLVTLRTDPAYHTLISRYEK